MSRTQEKLEVSPASRTTAHESVVTVAPFRAWRGSQPIIARGPARDTIKRSHKYSEPTSPHYVEIADINQVQSEKVLRIEFACQCGDCKALRRKERAILTVCNNTISAEQLIFQQLLLWR